MTIIYYSPKSQFKSPTKSTNNNSHTESQKLSSNKSSSKNVDDIKIRNESSGDKCMLSYASYLILSSHQFM